MDEDLERMTRQELVEEVKKLRHGIRAHRDSSGHDLCWHHPSLWSLLPEKTDSLPVVPEWPEFMRGCVQYRQSLDQQAPHAPRTNEPCNSQRAISEGIISPNKGTVEKYMQAFSRLDHAAVLSCLTNDVEWILPGTFSITGKESFDKEIENDAFQGSPAIHVTRLIEQHDVVVAEGSVRCARKDGGILEAVFCDVFVMQEAKIRRLTSYLMQT